MKSLLAKIRTRQLLQTWRTCKVQEYKKLAEKRAREQRKVKDEEPWKRKKVRQLKMLGEEVRTRCTLPLGVLPRDDDDDDDDDDDFPKIHSSIQKTNYFYYYRYFS